MSFVLQNNLKIAKAFLDQNNFDHNLVRLAFIMTISIWSVIVLFKAFSIIFHDVTCGIWMIYGSFTIVQSKYQYDLIRRMI